MDSNEPEIRYGVNEGSIKLTARPVLDVTVLA